MKKLFFLIIFVSFCFSLFAGEPPRGVTLFKDADGYTIKFKIPEYYFKDVNINSERFTVLSIPEYGITPEVGRPQLPQISFFLLIGKGELSVNYKVISQNTTTEILSAKIFPTQMPWEKNKPYKDRPFTIDREYYNSKGNIDEPIVKISEPFVIGGAKGVMITIFPFTYNPSEDKLIVTNTAQIKINLKEAAELGFIPQEAMGQFLSSVFVNYEATRTTGTNNYLIITAPDYESGLTPLVNHKQGMGFNVTVVNTNVTGTSNTTIKNYIQTLYNNINTRPEFILLVGDVDKIPDWIGGGQGTPHTDWNYALLEGGDLWVDAFLGRFPIQNLTQLSNIINKTIYMESSINNLWKKNVFMASTDNHLITEGTHNYVIDTFFIPNNFTVNTKLYSYYGATTAMVSASLDSNKIFAIYSGHGSETSWADGPPFSQANVNALNNTIYPFVYSYACVTGSFHISGECFAETWIRIPKAGVIFWGSSVNSYWDEDDILERRVVKALFNDNLKRNAENFVKGKIYLVQHYGSITPTMQRYMEMYNCMGDPSIYQLSYGPAISHNPLPNTENLNGPYIVNCTVSPAGSNILWTKLFWTRTNTYDSLNMTNTGGNNWTGNIPGNGQPAVYKYYLSTKDSAGRVTMLPIGAPTNYFSFIAATDTIKPVITHTPLTNTPKTSWPATVTATVTDNIGIDSVWVRWYKNTPSNGIKHFKLINTTGNTFTALFNSTQAEVNFNDSIYYRIYAQDNGSLHKRDSTSLYSFKIIAQANAIVGTGTTSVGYPFYTFYMDSRTDMLYLASEITAGGGAAGQIRKIGFNVISNATQVMNGFKVKMQTTTATTISGFTNTGWWVVYDSSYVVPGTGWQYIDLQTPFNWDGTSNLLIEICYNNSTWTSNTTVNATAATGKNVHNHSDLSSGDGCVDITSPGSTYTARPNISLIIDLVITGLENNITGIPDKYELSQNYPNPFNPVTKINFGIPKQGMVTLKIYDILGREVVRLINEVKPAGYYTIDFDGSGLSSGVYFYKLEVNGFSDVKRMVLIK